MDKKQNYMTVPAALKELEKIELLKGGVEMSDPVFVRNIRYPP